MKQNEKIRNIAIIAHVDHGKTTLVDQLFKQGGLFREGQATDDRMMDSMDLERERGITIAAKNCALTYEGTKINIIDTPGHADFGGEVERALSMADGAILLVDSSEGPLPQTRFVLEKALALNLSLIVCINKIDRPDSRIEEVTNEVYDLFIDLGADEDQLDFPLLFAIGRDGVAKTSLEDPSTTLKPLYDAIVEKIPGPTIKEDEPLQIMVSDLGYSDYLGRLAIGRLQNQSINIKESLVRVDEDGIAQNIKPTKLQVYSGLGLSEEESAEPGEIVILAGMDDAKIGDTICLKNNIKALPRLRVDEPTVSMKFSPNSSPLAGKEGKIVQSSKIWERLTKETLNNIAIEVEETENSEHFMVKGRGEFQLAILIETMRREGFELTVGRPEVIMQEKDGVKMEPIEHLYIDCEEGFTGIITEKLSRKKGRLINLQNYGSGRAKLEFEAPSRSLIGYRDEFLTDTKGTGLLNSYLKGYEEYKGDFGTKSTSSLVADRTGKAVPYALFNLEPRGRLFVTPGDALYEGMVIGEHNRDQDLNVNASKEKKLSNVRSSGKDDATILTPIQKPSLEQALQFISEDELLEVTPLNIRMRKVELNQGLRHIKRK
ncbi:MAG: translational GTPase TypA [SAR324 cluster bacterium]|nr:translational GTPase TypA [SAR324 cluster bacterium]